MNENIKGYFISIDKKKGTSYHEFQPGNRKNIFWSEDSLLLSDDLMAKSSLGTFFLKVIPNYDYHGITLVSKEIWGLIKEESKKENKMIRDIIKEMSNWADNSISTYGCFNLLGI